MIASSSSCRRVESIYYRIVAFQSDMAEEPILQYLLGTYSVNSRCPLEVDNGGRYALVPRAIRVVHELDLAIFW